MFREVKPNVLMSYEMGEPIQELANELKMNDTYEEEVDGLQVIMNYHAPTSSFIGVVENTTNQIISNVRVEIYLSNAVELGPTKPVNLQPGEMKNIALLAYNQEFKDWNVVVEFRR
jgi:hypothetical protein